MDKFTQLLHILCKEMQQRITHMHINHALIVIKIRIMTLFIGKIAAQLALFSEIFTRLSRILHDRWSHRSRQISSLDPIQTFARKRYFETKGNHKNCGQTYARPKN